MSIQRSLPGDYQVGRAHTETGGVSAGAARPRPAGGTRVNACEQGRQPAHVLSEDLFRGALARERGIADRAGQSFGLLLVTLDGALAPEGVRDKVIEAVAAVKRPIDVLGWFEQDRAIGLIAPEIGEDASLVGSLEGRVRQELTMRLGGTVARHAALQFHRYKICAKAVAAGQPIEPQTVDMTTAQAESRTYQFLKRSLDLVGSLALLILFSPVFVLVALAVKLTSRGPVFFRQARVGQGGRHFMMLKFRTMYPDAATSVHQQYVTWFIQSSSAQDSSKKPGTFKLANDPRVTPVGRFLRRTSLDELPQFWNVLRGEMSLVGPRPPLPYEVEQYKAWHCRRVLDAKPGITGLWQVAGRSRTTFDEMVRLDLRYARSRSLWTDLRILLATPGAVISGKGAC